MKTLIIIKGLNEEDIQQWLIKENLSPFYLNINDVIKLYSVPIYSNTFSGTVKTKSFEQNMLRTFYEILYLRLIRGSLIVLNPGPSSKESIILEAAKCMGYKVFYKIFDIPQDYLTNRDRYKIPGFRPIKETEARDEVDKFLSISKEGKHIINTFQEVLSYWSNNEPILCFQGKAKIMCIGDTHGEWDLLKNKVLPEIQDNFIHTIYLGDYTDGPDGGTRKMIEFIIRESKTGNTTFLEGNHECRLRKYLLFRSIQEYSGSGKILEEIVKSDIIESGILDSIGNEFSKLSIEEISGYIEALNNALKPYMKISLSGSKYLLTHAGLRGIEWLDPRYIGEVIGLSGKRKSQLDIDRDWIRSQGIKEGSNKKTNSVIASIHGHCKYGEIRITRPHNHFPSVFNLDQLEEGCIIGMEIPRIKIHTWKRTDMK